VSCVRDETGAGVDTGDARASIAEQLEQRPGPASGVKDPSAACVSGERECRRAFVVGVAETTFVLGRVRCREAVVVVHRRWIDVISVDVWHSAILAVRPASEASPQCRLDTSSNHERSSLCRAGDSVGSWPRSAEPTRSRRRTPQCTLNCLDTTCSVVSPHPRRKSQDDHVPVPQLRGQPHRSRAAHHRRDPPRRDARRNSSPTPFAS
jgi:hypothetical protein